MAVGLDWWRYAYCVCRPTWYPNKPRVGYVLPSLVNQVGLPSIRAKTPQLEEACSTRMTVPLLVCVWLIVGHVSYELLIFSCIWSIPRCRRDYAIDPTKA